VAKGRGAGCAWVCGVVLLRCVFVSRASAHSPLLSARLSVAPLSASWAAAAAASCTPPQIRPRGTTNEQRSTRKRRLRDARRRVCPTVPLCRRGAVPPPRRFRPSAVRSSAARLHCGLDNFPSACLLRSQRIQADVEQGGSQRAQLRPHRSATSLCAPVACCLRHVGQLAPHSAVNGRHRTPHAFLLPLFFVVAAVPRFHRGQ
jgi:hypothetical protein